MAKKKKKIDVILNRAQKLFAAENYLLAEKEFEKALKKDQSGEIVEKLDICRQKNRFAKGKLLVKKGYNAVKTNALQEAIDCFTQAQHLLDDPGLSEKILELEQQLRVGSIDGTAKKVEASGDYAKAANLYEQIWQKTGNQIFCTRSGVCHVKAGCDEQAVRIFQQADVQDDAGCYYYGFALAKTGQYPEAVIQWEKIDSRENAFIAQKKQVLPLAFSGLYRALEKGADINNIRSSAYQLQGIARRLGQTALAKNFGKMYNYCSMELLAVLWEQEKYVEIADLLEQVPFSNDPVFISLKAKTCYHLSKDNEAYLYPMVQSWFTAIFFQNPAVEFFDNPEDPKKIHQRLICLAEQRINGHAGSETVNRAAALFAVEKKLIMDLEAIYMESHTNTTRICTPFYAALSGRSQHILSVIRQNRAYFTDQEHYLETGGFYSGAWQSLYALRAGDPDKAHALVLEAIDAGCPGDEFFDYAVELVRFSFGQACLERGEKKYLPNFSSTHTLFASAPSIEQRFSDMLIRYDGDRMAEYELVVKHLYEKRPSLPISRALSEIMASMAIRRYNAGQITDRQLASVLRKALEINPDNDLANRTLTQTFKDIEMDDIMEALYKNKMQKAASIAAASEYPEVEEFFFQEAEVFFDQVCTSEIEKESMTIVFHKLRNACETVDASHTVMDKINEKLADLGE